MGEALAWTEDALGCATGPAPHQPCAARALAAQLEGAVQRLRGFNRSISHDLRGPLGAVSGVMRLAMEAIAHSDTPRALRLLSATAQHTEALTQLVADLLALAETDEFGEDDVDLERVVHEAIAQIQLTRLATACTVAPIQVGVLPTVRGSAGLLRQVFVNLLGNALKFTSETPEPLIEVGLCVSGSGTAIFVRDNGVGFPPAAAATLFQPFMRLHDGRYEGSGLGLSIVKRVVERHGGNVWANNAPDGGACFFFTLGGLDRASQEI